MNGLTTKTNSLGIDMFPVYQSSLFEGYVPTFEMIYGEYTMAIIQHDSNIASVEYYHALIREELSPVIEMTPSHELQPKAGVFNFLLEERYVFTQERTLFNPPNVEVW